jgi:hypothetical protein
VGQGILNSGVHRQELRCPQPFQDRRHRRLRATQQQVGFGPAAGGMVGHAGEHRSAGLIDRPQPGQVTDHRHGLFIQSFEQQLTQQRHGGRVEVADRGQDGAAIPGGLVDPDGAPPSPLGSPQLATANSS